MSRGNRQSGYALLLMLAVLLSGGIVLVTPFLPAQSAERTAESVMGHHSLQSARQSLLVYTTLYPYLYGPRGAGPAHLPCPDVDGSEGPDPPCGNASPATGHLPRHVSLPGYRYPFMTDISSSYRYRVASELINNPVNRVVNDQILERFAESSPYPVWVETGSAASLQARAPLSGRAMIPGLRKVVAAWLLARINREAETTCRASFVDALVQQQAGMDWLVLIADEPVYDGATPPGCADKLDSESLLAKLQIEGVSALSHWFIRNRWHERIKLSFRALPLSASDVVFR